MGPLDEVKAFQKRECAKRKAGQKITAAQAAGESTEQKIARLEGALYKINETIFAVGAPFGSENYFIIRAACCDALQNQNLP